RRLLVTPSLPLTGGDRRPHCGRRFGLLGEPGLHERSGTRERSTGIRVVGRAVAEGRGYRRLQNGFGRARVDLLVGCGEPGGGTPFGCYRRISVRGCATSGGSERGEYRGSSGEG